MEAVMSGGGITFSRGSGSGSITFSRSGNNSNLFNLS
jgi:hypothetical protein